MQETKLYPPIFFSRHAPKQQQQPAPLTVPAPLPPLPSAAEIADATAALVNARKQQVETTHKMI